MKTPCLVFALCILGFSATSEAQDLVRILDGPLLRGEIIQQSPQAIKLIDLMGKVHVIERAKIERIRKGRGLKKKTVARLANIKDKSEKALWEVVAWCAEQKSLKRDAKRLARRVLVMNPDHEAARRLLGHVKALGKWYKDEEAAFKAVEERMTSQGYVYASGGWIKSDRAADLAANPEDWLLINNFKWRPLAEVMRERGFKKYLEAWYPADQKHLIPRAEKLSRTMETEFHIAQVGSSVVLTIETREDAVEIATGLDKVRRWFGETFKVARHGRRRRLATEPENTAILLSDKEQLIQFGDKFKKAYNLSDASLAYQRNLNMTLWTPLSHAHAATDNLWPAQFPSQLGGSLLQWFWVPQDMELPPWMWVACAHLAEIEVHGAARVPYYAPDKYGQRETKAVKGSRSLQDARERVKDLKRLSLRSMMGKQFNNLSQEDDLVGMVYFAFLLDKHRDELIKFLTRPPCGQVWTRWKKCFGRNAEEMDHELKAWL